MLVSVATVLHLMATASALRRAEPSIPLHGRTSSLLAAVWAGTVSFDDPELATVNASLNVTLHSTGKDSATTSTSSFSWAFTRNSAGAHCILQIEPALLWSVNGSQITALGDSTQNFYTFQGTLEPQSTRQVSTIHGFVYHPPFSARKRVGTFSIRPVDVNNPQQPPHCASPRPQPPGPPGPPPPSMANPPIWPAPREWTPPPHNTGTQAIVDGAALALTCDAPGTTCADVIAPAFARGKTWAFATPGADATGSTLHTVVVTVGAIVPLQHGANESYRLEVNMTHVVVTAPTQWGAMHGLESFFQLILIEPWETCPVCNKYVVRTDVRELDPCISVVGQLLLRLVSYLILSILRAASMSAQTYVSSSLAVVSQVFLHHFAHCADSDSASPLRTTGSLLHRRFASSAMARAHDRHGTALPPPSGDQESHRCDGSVQAQRATLASHRRPIVSTLPRRTARALSPQPVSQRCDGRSTKLHPRCNSRHCGVRGIMSIQI